jgi:protein-tyrosine phosphatase
MRQVQPYALWIGHQGNARDFVALLRAEVRALVQLAAEEPPVQPPRELIYYRFPLLDGTGNPVEHLTLAVQAVTELLRRQLPTALCCGNGVSRSPAIAAAAIALFKGLDLAESLKRIADQHRCDISPGFLHDLREALWPHDVNS